VTHGVTAGGKELVEFGGEVGVLLVGGGLAVAGRGLLGVGRRRGRGAGGLGIGGHRGGNRRLRLSLRRAGGSEVILEPTGFAVGVAVVVELLDGRELGI